MDTRSYHSEENQSTDARTGPNSEVSSLDIAADIVADILEFPVSDGIGVDSTLALRYQLDEMKLIISNLREFAITSAKPSSRVKTSSSMPAPTRLSPPSIVESFPQFPALH